MAGRIRRISRWAHPDLNPFRYIYPGTNNPTSYDLWIDLRISGKTNLICNWSHAPIILQQQTSNQTHCIYVHQRRQRPGLLEVLAERRVARLLVVSRSFDLRHGIARRNGTATKPIARGGPFAASCPPQKSF